MNWADYSKTLLEKCKRTETPFACSFALTPLCNFRCNMCYVRLDPGQAAAQGRMLTAEQWLDLAREAKRLGTVSMEITGGEPLVRPDFVSLYSAFIDLGFLVVFRTNGYLLDTHKIDLLRDRRPYKIIITLYGATDRTYEKVCGVVDGFTVVSRNILALLDAGLDVRLTTTITKDNVHEVEDMQTWAHDHGIALALCGMLLTPNEGTNRSVEHLKVRLPDEVYELTEEMKSFERQIPNRKDFLDPFWMCRAFGAKFTISWDGKLSLCNTSTSIWEDPFTHGLEQAYHDLYRRLKALRRPEECASCRYIDFCSVCPSMLYSATGHPDRTSDEMCRIARRSYKNHLLLTGKGNESAVESSMTVCSNETEV